VKVAIAVTLACLLAVGCDDKGPVSPRTWGPPTKSIRFASYNTLKSGRGRDKVLADIRSKSPDIVCLQEVPTHLAHQIARDLGMHHAFRKHVNLPGEGIAIYSRWPLESVAAVIDTAGRTCGLFADTHVDGRAFTVATVHLQATSTASVGNVLWSERVRGEEFAVIRKTWSDRGSRPIIIGGDFNQIPIGPNYSKMTTSLKDALAWIGKSSPTLGEGDVRVRVDYFLCSKEWRPVDGGVVESDASDHDLIWLDARASSAAGNEPTPPATSPASMARRR
jgi:endonuclease/exonuclease/phosphatase family metal-dependent hydrolase